ncbi:NAD-dependent epimerase/dehydratase [Colletotrichum graminicola]|nr:NAD-dependent epimerase/dehydratase [Colletotrichum graminicola]
MASEASHILITGPAGFIGQELITALFLSSHSIHLTATDITTPPIPLKSIPYASRVTTAVASLLAHHSRFNAIYLLLGVMSGGAEGNLDLGLRVNVGSHRFFLDPLRQETSPHRGTYRHLPSSLAVYRPAAPGQVNTKSTFTTPQSSYGAQKLMIETLFRDYSCRGLLDGRIVRPGAPSATASSSASGIVRRSLKGEENVMPVRQEVVNLPGVTITVADILDALETIGGKEARSLVREERNPQIEAIVER